MTMYMNLSINNFDLNKYDTDVLKDLGDNLKTAPEKYEDFVSTLPSLVENLTQGQLFLTENQKRLTSDRLRSRQRFDQFDVSQTKENKQTIKRFSTDFELLNRSIDHLITFGENLKALLVRGKQIQTCDDNQFNTLEEVAQTLRKLRTTLISQSLEITTQPPPVLKKGQSIDTEVNSLANVSQVSVRIRIISNDDAAKLSSGSATCEEIVSPATIVENRAVFEEIDGILTSQFNKKPVLKTITHSWLDGESQESIEEQKFVLLYEIINDHEKDQISATSNRIWAISLPFVLITHSVQYCYAYASAIWHREFNDEKTVEWQKIAVSLKKLFFYLTGARTRGLSDYDLAHIRRKLGVVTNNGSVSLKRFAKDDVEYGIKFSFWTWFFSLCEVIKASLLQYWEKGYLMGFGSKESIAKKISSQDKCTFLLRFSDSQLGALSISRFDFDSNGHRHTPFLLPTDQELHSLAKLLENFDQLKEINFFCDKDFNIIDKKRFLNDTDLRNSSNQNGSNSGEAQAVSLYIQCVNGLWKFIQSPFVG